MGLSNNINPTPETHQAINNGIEINPFVRMNYLQHQNDYGFITSILDMNLEDEEVVGTFQECSEIKFLNEMISDIGSAQ